MHTAMQILYVALGSAVGGLARWGLGAVAARLVGAAFPWGTLLINISGSLLLGWFSTLLAERLDETKLTWFRPEDLRLLVAVGFTGAYTTFSSFEYETHILLRHENGLGAAAYVAGSIFLGLLAVRLGVYLAHQM